MKKHYQVCATIQARMNSTRFYGKVIKPILNISMLEHIVLRIKPSKTINNITIATTTNPCDDVIEKQGQRLGVNIYRGSEDDVLGRIIGAAKQSKCDLVVRLTGDNPLYSADLIDSMVEYFLESDYDLVANTAMMYAAKWGTKRTFPLGLGIQILETRLLEKIGKRYSDHSSREHVTLPILRNPHVYKLGAFHAKGKFAELNRPHYRLTIDTAEDFCLVTEIFRELYPKDKYFSVSSVIELLDKRPDLVGINADVVQRVPVDGAR